MYDKIINPISGKFVSTNGKIGKKIIHKYIFLLQNGGSSTDSDIFSLLENELNKKDDDSELDQLARELQELVNDDKPYNLDKDFQNLLGSENCNFKYKGPKGKNCYPNTPAPPCSCGAGA